jgi:hypothetical protein
MLFISPVGIHVFTQAFHLKPRVEKFRQLCITAFKLPFGSFNPLLAPVDAAVRPSFSHFDPLLQFFFRSAPLN